MARLHGRHGRIYVGLASDSAEAEPIAYLNKWSINFAVDRTEVTAMGDANKTYLSGLPDASGDWGGFYDSTSDSLYTAGRDGVPRRFYLYPSTQQATTYFFGTAIFDYKVEGGVGDAVGVSGSWAAASDILKESA